MTGLFLQVRLTSERLPRKALLDLGGKPMIVHCIERLQKVPADVYAISTHDTSYDELKPYADAAGWGIIIGPEGDVLSCLRNAASHYGVDTVIRATGDNPLVNPDLFTWMLHYHRQNKADLTRVRGAPVGACGEILSRRALMIADCFADSRDEREHVTPFMRARPEIFDLHLPEAPLQWQGSGRLTVDTASDYEAIKKYF